MPLPKHFGFHMPAEWEHHEATWLSWPHNQITWFNSQTKKNLVKKIEDIYVEEIVALHEGESVNILVNGYFEQIIVYKKLKDRVNMSKINFFRIQTVDVWIRDYGPIFLVNEDRTSLAMLNFEFDAWGKKYTPENFQDDPASWLINDGVIPRKMYSHLDLLYFKESFVLEGGSIDVNGQGSLLTTKQCLLNENYLGNKRNPHISQLDIEQNLNETLNVNNIIWLEEGILGDDTDGHVDDIARFVAPKTILYACEKDESNPNYRILQKNLELLKSSKDQTGSSFDLVPLPMPGPVLNPNFDPARPETNFLPASYANFYIGNSAVLVPVFGDKKNDDIAVSTIKQFFPDRKIVPIYAGDFVMGLGTFHCSTQQQPKIKK